MSINSGVWEANGIEALQQQLAAAQQRVAELEQLLTSQLSKAAVGWKGFEVIQLEGEDIDAIRKALGE